MPKIVVLEDDPAILDNIIELLTFEGYEVFSAGDGAEGMKIIYETRPDLIVCDIMMPGLDGYGVLVRVREDPILMMTPFIFLTAKASRAETRYGMDMGADDYLPKPFTTKELLDMINSRLELSATRRREYEKRINELRTSVTYSLPHELRTPLTTILGYTALLLEGFDSIDREKAMNMLTGMQQSGMRLYRLLENYLLYAQLDVLTVDVKRVSNLRSVRTEHAGNVITEVATQWADNAQRLRDLTISVDDGAVQMSATHLGRIVEELVDNAFKFSPPGTSVTVTAHPQGDMYMIEVSDNGYGMSSEQIDSIGAYMQFDRRIYEQQGVGLGLVNAKRLVEIHGGTVRIVSELDAGTVITIMLPV